MKKTYFFKFVGLPFFYSSVLAANKKVAQDEVKQYRDDGVCFETDQIAVSFRDYHNTIFKYESLENIQQYVSIKIKNAINGYELIKPVRKNKILQDLKYHFSDIPGIDKANIITIGSKSCFGIKNSPKLTSYVMTLLGVSEVPKELKQKDAFIPICFFSVTKENQSKKESGENHLAITESSSFGDNDSNLEPT